MSTTTNRLGPVWLGRTLFSRVASRPDGIATVEFAYALPVFVMLTLGGYDAVQMTYGKTLLDAAVQKAARSSAIEAASTSQADAQVLTAVRKILPDATMTSTRTNYYDFADIGQPEPLNDADGDGSCDNGETYTDENNNGDWDADVGVSGNGGAGDVVVYTVVLSYKPAFSIPFTDGDTLTLLSSSTVRKNQPYATQATYATLVRTCN